MTVSEPVVDLPSTPAVRPPSAGPEHCIWHRADGIYADPAVLGTMATVCAILYRGFKRNGWL